MDNRSSFSTWCEKVANCPRTSTTNFALLNIASVTITYNLYGWELRIFFNKEFSSTSMQFAVPMNSFGLLSAGMSPFLFKNGADLEWVTT
jgi:hypothetical protein